MIEVLKIHCAQHFICSEACTLVKNHNDRVRFKFKKQKIGIFMVDNKQTIGPANVRILAV
jgi:hypothetical protein